MNDPATCKTPSSTAQGRGALTVGFLAALLASSCCIAPLALVLVGISGAWIGYFHVFEPYRLWFAGAAAIALFFAARRIWARTPECVPGQVCALPPVRRGYKAFFWIAVLILAVAVGFPLIAHWFY